MFIKFKILINPKVSHILCLMDGSTIKIIDALLCRSKMKTLHLLTLKTIQIELDSIHALKI